MFRNLSALAGIALFLIPPFGRAWSAAPRLPKALGFSESHRRRQLGVKSMTSSRCRIRSTLLSSSSSSEDSESIYLIMGLNELHTRLCEAVAIQDYETAGKISSALATRLRGNNEGNVATSRRRLSWKGLGAAPWLSQRLDELMFTFPTTIQINSMEAVHAILRPNIQMGFADDDITLQERVTQSTDPAMGLVVSGTTGSGKTLAYLVPLLSALSDSLFQRQRLRTMGGDDRGANTPGSNPTVSSLDDLFEDDNMDPALGADWLERLKVITPSTTTTDPAGTGLGPRPTRSVDDSQTTMTSLGFSGSDVKRPLALIVTPSRELGIQIASVLYQLVGGAEGAELQRSRLFTEATYKGPRGVRIATVLDQDQASAGLELQTDIAITMPQYLESVIGKKDVDPEQLRVIVFDEADLALEQTSSQALQSLFAENDDDDDEYVAEYSRLTFLVGASVTESLGNLAIVSRILPENKSWIATATRFAPLKAQARGEATTSMSSIVDNEHDKMASLRDLNLCLYPGLTHQRALVDNNDKSRALLVLTRLLRKELQDFERSLELPPNTVNGRNSDIEQTGLTERPRVMIFFPNEEEARDAIAPLRDALWGEHRLCVLLPQSGVNPLTMLDQFKRNETTVMLATPNSVRGLDVPGVSHVYALNLTLLEDPREYVHLAGRVGRVGQLEGRAFASGGRVITLLPQQKGYLMEKLSQTLDFTFTDIDVENLVVIPKPPPTTTYSTDESTEIDDTSSNKEEVEAMRRYLEDSFSFLTLSEEPEIGFESDEDENEDD